MPVSIVAGPRHRYTMYSRVERLAFEGCLSTGCIRYVHESCDLRAWLLLLFSTSVLYFSVSESAARASRHAYRRAKSGRLTTSGSVDYAFVLARSSFEPRSWYIKPHTSTAAVRLGKLMCHTRFYSRSLLMVLPRTCHRVICTRPNRAPSAMLRTSTASEPSMQQDAVGFLRREPCRARW